MKSTVSFAELKRKRTPLRNINIEHRERLTRVELFAVWITEHVGTMGFFALILLWTLAWLSWNIFAPRSLQFDPFPAFVFWLFISNMIQILLMPLIMVGQNLQGKHSEARAEADFEVNKQAEQEIEMIITHLENQEELLHRLLARIENDR